MSAAIDHLDDGTSERLRALPWRELGDGLRVYEATSFRARSRGLARLPALPAHLALHIDPCRSIHTFGMRFALDLVWLDRDGGVVRIDRGIRPRRGAASRRSRSVIELASGAADRFLSAGLGSRRP